MKSSRAGARRGAAPDLPAFYYHSHFVEMLDFVGNHYPHILEPAQQAFIQDFRQLDMASQCLYVRLVNRKGRVFAVNKLRYPEIGPLAGPIDALRNADWIAPPAAEHFVDVLTFLTRDEIYRCLLPFFSGASRSLRKAELVDFVASHCDPDKFMANVDPARLVVQRRCGIVQFLMFLYFGDSRDGLSRFTLRDMGLVNTQSFRDHYEPRFSDPEEARETFYFSTRLQQLETATTGQRRDMMSEASQWPDPISDGAARLRDSLALGLGKAAEQAGHSGVAADLFRLGTDAACSERLVRLLLRTGQRDAAKLHLEACLANPGSDEEWFFANGLYQRKFGGKRRSARTNALRAAETLDLDESLSGSPERAAIAHYESLGLRAYRAENRLWRTLFGLLFWDELFAAESAALHSPFEMLPADLQDGRFYCNSGTQIETRLRLLETPAAARHRLLKVSTRHYGRANGVFRWRPGLTDAVFALIQHAPAAAVAAQLRRMCANYMDTRHGYPDLLVIDSQGARFVEIKAEGDQLRRNQLVRREQLQTAGFRADIVRIRWILDPKQVYVVVDIETTGGRGEQHRVTELGAVRVQDGRLLERFTTLVNPDRTIPPGITRLTGISDAMVADAPRFGDVADDFTKFIEGAIFVAHNVNFDYGFIAAEYSRLGRRFRYPKLCTCASMRRLYPGQRSYSLEALCQAYDIALKTHHRALCDAEAAAGLLLLVNEKRAELLQQSR